MREPQYETDPKFNWNRLLSLPFVHEIDVTPYAAEEVVVRFPDVSYYQGVIEFAKMAAEAQGVILRAGQGIWRDPQFIRNYTEAKKHGMKRGIYFFYDDRRSPQQHFEVIKGLLDEYGLPEMEIWIDWENSYGGAHGRLKDVVALMELVEKEYPTAVVGMYTGFFWMTEHSNPITNYFQYRYLAKHPLWLAYYTNEMNKVRIPSPWTYMRHWQYGTPSIGHTYGVQSIEIDMNIETDPNYSWEELYGDNHTPEPKELEVIIWLNPPQSR